MITFGYKNRFNGPIRALTAIAIGLVMVISKANALNIAVRVIAAFLIASGVVSMLVGYKNRSEGTMGLMGFNAAVDVFLGCVLFIWPGAVSGLLIFIIGAALFGFGNLEAFPIDVWMRRAIDEYFGGKLDPASLGRYAGVAQQYIFHYIRYLSRI